jgi:hypothetical protein
MLIQSLDENLLNFHLEFLRHFEVLFLKIHNFFVLWSRLLTYVIYVIRSTLNLIAHETTIASSPTIELFDFWWSINLYPNFQLPA